MTGANTPADQPDVAPPQTAATPANGRTKPSLLALYGPTAAIVALCALTLAVVVVRQPEQRTTATAAPVATGAGPADFASIATYPPGVMTYDKAKADGKLDQYEWGERCDTESGRLALPLNPRQPCFAKFTGDNGGATTTGVTDDEIRVVAYLNSPNDPILSFIYGQLGMTAPPDAAEEAYQQFNEILGTYYELYGRKVKIIPYTATGSITDAVSSVADAETIARDIKPFAVLGGPQLSAAFGDTLAANKVLCIGCAENQTNEFYESRAPYSWTVQKSLDENFTMVGEYLVKRLNGRNAEFAGDKTMHSKKRVFAFIHAQAAEDNAAADKLFVDKLAEQGVEFASVQTYANPLTLNVDGRAIIAKLKQLGVTTVVVATDPIAPQALTKVATAQDYFPEWVGSGQTLVDSTVFARTYDQEQWAHFFGPTNLFPRVKSGAGAPIYLFKWFFGEDPAAGAAALLSVPNLQVLYAALQGIGPNVTPEAFQTILFSAPILPSSSIAPQISFGNRGFFAAPDFAVLDDQTEFWWDPDTEGPAESGTVGKGVYRYVDGGKRFLPGKWPEGQPKVFDKSNSVNSFDKLPPDAEPIGDYAPIAGPRKGKTIDE